MVAGLLAGHMLNRLYEAPLGTPPETDAGNVATTIDSPAAYDVDMPREEDNRPEWIAYRSVATPIRPAPRAELPQREPTQPAKSSDPSPTAPPEPVDTSATANAVGAAAESTFVSEGGEGLRLFFARRYAATDIYTRRRSLSVEVYVFRDREVVGELVGRHRFEQRTDYFFRRTHELPITRIPLMAGPDLIELVESTVGRWDGRMQYYAVLQPAALRRIRRHIAQAARAENRSPEVVREATITIDDSGYTVSAVAF